MSKIDDPEKPHPVIDRNGNWFPSVEEAAERYGVKPSLILRYVQSARFGWKYDKQTFIPK